MHADNPLQEKMRTATVPLVGKLMANREDVKAEIESAALVLEADPLSEFTIAPIGSCNVVAKMSDLDNCDSVTKKLKKRLEKSNHIPQLVVEDGGRDLAYHMMKADTSVITILRAAKRLVKGLIAFKEHKIVHMDIKPENVVFNGTSLKLIDHGLMMAVDCTFYKRLRSFGMFHYSYPWYPPEFDWLSKIEMGRKNFKSDEENTDIRECITVTRIPKVDTHRERDLAHMDRKLKDILSPPMESMYRYMSISKKMFWSKIDVYSLGITLGEFFAEKRGHHGMTPHQVDAFVEWVSGASHFNVFKRFTPEESYASYKLIFKDEHVQPSPKKYAHPPK